MPCTGRFASAWQFASYFCVGSYVSGVDGSGGAGNLFLTDPWVIFPDRGFVPNVGMILYNVTDGTQGFITAVDGNTMTAPGTVWDDGDQYRAAALNSIQRSAIELNLDKAASDIFIALAASGACDCAFSTYGQAFLDRLNVTIAAAFYACTCGKPAVIVGEVRVGLMEWVDAQLVAIREGKLEVCQGETGSDFPVVSWAEQGTTEFARANIILNDMLRNLP